MSSSTNNMVTVFVGNDAEEVSATHRISPHGPHMNNTIHITDRDFLPVVTLYLTDEVAKRLRDALNACEFEAITAEVEA